MTHFYAGVNRAKISFMQNAWWLSLGIVLNAAGPGSFGPPGPVLITQFSLDNGMDT